MKVKLKKEYAGLPAGTGLVFNEETKFYEYINNSEELSEKGTVKYGNYVAVDESTINSMNDIFENEDTDEQYAVDPDYKDTADGIANKMYNILYDNPSLNENDNMIRPGSLEDILLKDEELYSSIKDVQVHIKDEKVIAKQKEDVVIGRVELDKLYQRLAELEGTIIERVEWDELHIRIQSLEDFTTELHDEIEGMSKVVDKTLNNVYDKLSKMQCNLIELEEAIVDNTFIVRV